MAGKITDLTNMNGAASIDRTTDLLEIVDLSGNASYKATPNFILGFTGGNPVSTSDTQILTNKTLGITNTVTVLDTLFTLQDDGDNTKQAKFQTSGITTATTRTYTLPNSTSTLVDLITTQTLTNKTLTSPTINTATIVNPTLTVDAVTGFSDSDSGTMYGITVTNGVIQGTVFANASVVPNNLLAGTGTTWTWSNWSPSYTNITVGNGTVVAKFIQDGKTVHFYYALTFGSTTSITGSNPKVSAPITLSANYAANTQIEGNMIYFDASAGQVYTGILLNSTNDLFPVVNNSAATLTVAVGLGTTTPVAFATGDILSLVGTYQAS